MILQFFIFYFLLLLLFFFLRVCNNKNIYVKKKTPHRTMDPPSPVVVVAVNSNPLKNLLKLTKRKQSPALVVDQSLTETHLVLYVAWRKLWMERDLSSGQVRSLTLSDLHKAVVVEASELAIDQLRLCSVVPDWNQMVKVIRSLSRRGVLRLHAYTSSFNTATAASSRLHVVMNDQAGEDMLKSINAAILDQLDASQAQYMSAKKRQRTQKNQTKGSPLPIPRKKVYHIPSCILELHLEYERRDLVLESQRFRAAAAEKT